MNFPTWLFHPDKEAKIFKCQKEVDDAGEGWVDTPEKFKKATKKVIPKKKKVAKS